MLPNTGKVSLSLLYVCLNSVCLLFSVLEIKESSSHESNHETFHKLLQKDGFSTIASYFGRGMLKNPLEEDL